MARATAATVVPTASTAARVGPAVATTIAWASIDRLRPLLAPGSLRATTVQSRAGLGAVRPTRVRPLGASSTLGPSFARSIIATAVLCVLPTRAATGAWTGIVTIPRAAAASRDQDSRRLSLRPYEDARVTAAGARVATVTRAACAVPLDASRPDGEDVIGPGLELE
eukprot:CAMPEP_0181212020 /NCGR_PEP_ID=MMETSP1096-20121128/24116_1 /TAXON_ID=156174 ORGANISM="Chrysochromulina ericina, Strain CCMP281" /NCGR_SAMPLE_ID=MMETSP1096 /ASSEMBLY_ACC=CAM_ASM_000453 /LENGTH=166 /DNA_ID=CAMNT_0023303499 /DNA_START=946 /DNA_END=1443 /DNA_ORIENTATION=+